MGHWSVCIDRDFVRQGFELDSLKDEGVAVVESERLSAEMVLIAVLSYVGGKVLDHIFEKSLEVATGKLLGFARGKDRKLRVEIEERNFDPRVKLLAFKIDLMDAEELRDAIGRLDSVKRHSERVLDSAGEDLNDLWYVWKDGGWRFSYYSTASNEVVDSVEFDVSERESEPESERKAGS